MKEENSWIIIDKKRSVTVNGFKNQTMFFSTQEIAFEVARQLFEKREEYDVVQIKR